MYGHAVTSLTPRRDSSHGVELATRNSFGGRKDRHVKELFHKAAAHWANHKRGIVEGEAIPRTIKFRSAARVRR